MGYKNPNDQYRVGRASEMIKEIKASKPMCDGSTVMSYKKIEFGGGDHAGTLSHVCGLEKNHEGKCRCKNCEAEFYKIG